MHKKAIFLLVAGITVFAFLSKFIGTSSILEVLMGANPILILLTIFFQVVLILVWTFRWQLVFDNLKNIKISVARLFPYLLLVNFGDVITPGPRFGAEPLVAYYMEKKEKIKEKDSLTTMLIERLYGLVVFNILSVISIILLILFVPINIWMFLLIAVSLIISLFISFLIFHSFMKEKEGIKFVEKTADKILRFIYHLRKRKRFAAHETFRQYESNFNRQIKLFFDEVVVLSKDKKLWFNGIFMSFVFYLVLYLQAYFSFYAVNVHVPLYLVVVTITLAELVGFVVLLPSGVGITEVLFIGISVSAGIPIANAVAATLLIRGVYYIFGLATGYLSMLWLAEK